MRHDARLKRLEQNACGLAEYVEAVEADEAAVEGTIQLLEGWEPEMLLPDRYGKVLSAERREELAALCRGVAQLVRAGELARDLETVICELPAEALCWIDTVGPKERESARV